MPSPRRRRRSLPRAPGDARRAGQPPCNWACAGVCPAPPLPNALIVCQRPHLCFCTLAPALIQRQHCKALQRSPEVHAPAGAFIVIRVLRPMLHPTASLPSSDCTPALLSGRNPTLQCRIASIASHLTFLVAPLPWAPPPPPFNPCPVFMPLALTFCALPVVGGGRVGGWSQPFFQVARFRHLCTPFGDTCLSPGPSLRAPLRVLVASCPAFILWAPEPLWFIRCCLSPPLPLSFL